MTLRRRERKQSPIQHGNVESLRTVHFFTMLHQMVIKTKQLLLRLATNMPDREPVSFVNVRLNQAIKLVTLQKANFVWFSVGDDVQKSNSTQPSLNDVLMDSARMKCWPTKRKNTDTNKNDKLFNNTIETFESLNIKGFSMHNVETTGKNFCQLCNSFDMVSRSSMENIGRSRFQSTSFSRSNLPN